MWPFKRKQQKPTITDARPILDQASLTEPVRPAASPGKAFRPGSALLRMIPLDRILDGLISVLRDPNGKISSKRAGAGALVVAGIHYVAEPDTFAAGIVCLVAAILLFFLTKYETP